MEIGEVGQEGQLAVLVVMQPQSLRVRLPSHWTVQKLKLLLVSTLPTLSYDSFVITHLGEPLPPTLTLQTLAQTDQITLHLATVPNSSQPPSITPLLELRSLLSSSPFQPCLHPKYYGLQ